MLSYPVNLNWIQGFAVSAARLVIWAGADVQCVLGATVPPSERPSLRGPEKADTPGLG